MFAQPLNVAADLAPDHIALQAHTLLFTSGALNALLRINTTTLREHRRFTSLLLQHTSRIALVQCFYASRSS